MSWFNLPDDENLLHSSVRGNDEIQNVIDRAEIDVFSHYREGGEIKLDGYDADPEEADADLVIAVKNTIADIVSFRIRGYNDEYGVQSIRQGQRSISFRQSPYWTSKPNHWNSLLTDFDSREALFYV